MVKADANVKEVKFTAKIIRADGKVEDLGVISSYKKKTVFEKLASFFSNK